MALMGFSASSHPKVLHPRTKLPVCQGRLEAANDRLLDWVTRHILASMVMFDVALVLPLLAIPLSDSVKITLGVVSGSWIQWWALHALQRSQMKEDRRHEAKAEADHEALTHIALQLDRVLDRLDALEAEFRSRR